METYVCPRCGNSEKKYLGIRKGEIYCRRCISFHGKEAVYTKGKPKDARLDLKYHLSKEQQELSKQIVTNYKKGIDTLVYAVCGSGKTEISYGILAYGITQGLKVGFALPRRDVVIELFYRLKGAFPENKIVAVYGEHTSTLEGDIVILTTHQLYRYPKYFDVLVMDEIDAFPFKDNNTLIALYKSSLRGHSVLMSATPSKEMLDEYKKEKHAILELRTRFHKKEIPVPNKRVLPLFLQKFVIIRSLKKYQAEGKPCFVFAPAIDECESLFHFLKFFVKGGNFVHSKRENRDEVIKSIKTGTTSFLVTTSVLERGVTVKNLQVIVYKADQESIYDSATLIQIAGRVGRKADAPDGEVLFLAQKATGAMEEAINEIKYCNTYL